MFSSELQSKCLALFCSVSTLQACSSQKTNSKSTEDRLAAIQTLQSELKPINATVTESSEIDWSAGSLPWDRYTLPTLSPNGLHAAVQLGRPPSANILSSNSNMAIDSTNIELHLLDPDMGKTVLPFNVSQKGLILGRSANNTSVLVESPRGEAGRWIGEIDWATGNLTWVASDHMTNAFPAINAIGNIAWSRTSADEDRFHLVLKTAREQRIIDDGKSDWLLPSFLGTNRLRVFRLQDGSLDLVELDLLTKNPLLTAIYLPIIRNGATRELAWQIATTNPTSSENERHAFYHPERQQMVIWQPGEPIELASLLPQSVAAAPVQDGSWLVSTQNRMVRQNVGSVDGVHIRNRFAIPIATTSSKWTHLILVPRSNRLEVRAINLSN